MRLEHTFWSFETFGSYFDDSSIWKLSRGKCERLEERERERERESEQEREREVERMKRN